MKVAIAIIVTIVVVLWGYSALRPTTSQFTVRVDGTPQMIFQLHCVVIQPDGTSATVSREDLMPRDYTITASAISCNAQKEGPGSNLLVLHILKAGTEVQTSRTILDYGSAQATAN